MADGCRGSASTGGVVRWILGNPLIAITMIRHDITAGLFAPVEILVTEKERGPGTTITYVRPSSLIFIEVTPHCTQQPKRSMRSWRLGSPRRPLPS